MATRQLGGLATIQYGPNPNPARWVDAAGFLANRVQYPDLATLVDLSNMGYNIRAGSIVSTLSSPSGLAASATQFCAVAGAASQNTATSPDGYLWTLNSAVLPASATWQSLTFGAGLFVAFKSISTVDYATSPDGVVWTPRVLANPIAVRRCVFDGTNFLIVVNGTTAALTSTDGINWNPITITTGSASGTYSWALAIPGSHGFLVYNSGSGLVGYSATGAAWATASVSPGISWACGAASPTTIVLVVGNMIHSSTDFGATWTVTPSMANNSVLAYCNDVFLLGNSTTCYASPDGIHWYQRPGFATNSTTTFYPAAVVNGTAILVPSATSTINLIPAIPATKFWVPLPTGLSGGQRYVFLGKSY